MSKMLRHAVIVCHPAQQSFTHSVAERYAGTIRAHGHEVVLRDLYQLNFDPVLRQEERDGQPGSDVLREWAELGKPDVFVLVYPIWFGAPPAMIVGYIDRVFGAGRTRGQDAQGGFSKLLAGKRLVSLTSSGSMHAWLSEKGVLGSLRTVYDRYLTDVFEFAETVRHHSDAIKPDLPERDVAQHLLEVENMARDVMARLSATWKQPRSGWIKGPA